MQSHRTAEMFLAKMRKSISVSMWPAIFVDLPKKGPQLMATLKNQPIAIGRTALDCTHYNLV